MVSPSHAREFGGKRWTPRSLKTAPFHQSVDGRLNRTSGKDSRVRLRTNVNHVLWYKKQKFGSSLFFFWFPFSKFLSLVSFFLVLVLGLGLGLALGLGFTDRSWARSQSYAAALPVGTIEPQSLIRRLFHHVPSRSEHRRFNLSQICAHARTANTGIYKECKENTCEYKGIPGIQGNYGGRGVHVVISCFDLYNQGCCNYRKQNKNICVCAPFFMREMS